MGFFQSNDNVLATTATDLKGSPIPGPFVKAITSISSFVMFASFIAFFKTVKTTSRWCFAVCFGRNPFLKEILYILNFVCFFSFLPILVVLCMYLLYLPISFQFQLQFQLPIYLHFLQ